MRALTSSRQLQLWFLACLLVVAFLVPNLVVYSQQILQVGFSILTVEDGARLPVASTLFSVRNAEDTLVWEAGVAAVEPTTSGRIFVDESELSRTALALANPSEQDLQVSFTLRDSDGMEEDGHDLVFNAKQHESLFIDELFSISDDFVGNLTFEASGDGKLAAVTLRQNFNRWGEEIFATFPVADLTEDAPSDSVIFPHVGAGQGLSTQLVLINPSQQPASGTVRLTASDGTSLVASVAGVLTSEIPYEIDPHGSFKTELTSFEAIRVGYAEVLPDVATPVPAGTAIFQFRQDGRIQTEAGVGGQLPTTRARIFVDNIRTRTGVALASPQNPQTELTFHLMDRYGEKLLEATRDIAPNGHLSVFADELFPTLPAGFTGQMEIAGADPFVPVTLKLTQNSRGDPVLTTLPVADLTRPPEAPLAVFPQIGTGEFGGLKMSTRLLLINTDDTSGGSGKLSFFQTGNSQTMSLTLGDLEPDQTGAFGYSLIEGGALEFRPGNEAQVASLLPDTFQTDLTEVVVNLGNQVRVRPLIIDTEGNPRDDFVVTYSSTDPEVATIDETGLVSPRRAGFSTLTMSAGGTLRVATITAVQVEQSPRSDPVTGIAPDLAGRLYLASKSSHVILRAESLESEAEVFAGKRHQPGLINGERLNALFRDPAFIAFDQARGDLYVTDSGNHVIRRVRADGSVETFAGREGQAGSADGELTQAQFRAPQGLVLDAGGRLWVADSGNHTIRKVNLSTRVVETVAGSAGLSGLADGSGDEARFSSPTGLAIEAGSLRELRGRRRINIIVADTGNRRIRRVSENGEVETVQSSVDAAESFGTPSQTASQPLLFDRPTGVAADSLGNIYVTEPESRKVITILATGRVVLAMQPGQTIPRNIVSFGGDLLVADAASAASEIVYGTPEIEEITPDRVRAAGGELVTVRGRNFAPDSLVIVGDQVVDASILTTAALTFRVPPATSGRVNLTVQHRGGLVQGPVFMEPVPFEELEPGEITTVAGGSTFVGDGGLATAAPMMPRGVAVGVTGDVYIVDIFRARIRRVDPSGIVTTVAGTGEFGFSGDGGPATAANLNAAGVAVDRSGNLYIADGGNGRVRRVDPSGIITTVAGTGESGFSGDGGLATAAALSPTDVALDELGNLFIVDHLNNRIRRVDPSGIIITVAGREVGGFAGDGGPATAATLNRPRDVAVDGAGNLYVADTDNHRVRRIDPFGIITTVAGTGEGGFSGDGGGASAARLNYPDGVAIDVAGNLFIADRVNFRIRRVDPSGVISTVAGTGFQGYSGDGGPAIAARLFLPEGVATDGTGNLYIADAAGQRLRRVDPSGFITTMAGRGESEFFDDGGPATGAALRANGLAVDGGGNLYVSDPFGNRIRRVDPVGIITTVAGTGEGGFSGDGGPATAARLRSPAGVAVDDFDNLFIADVINSLIRRVDSSGSITTVAGSRAPNGFLGDGGPATAAHLNWPRGVVIDDTGNLLIADTDNHRIRRVDSSGIIITVAGNGARGFSGDGGPATDALLEKPRFIAVDGAGNLYISDEFNHRIRRVDPFSIITTVAGTGEVGFSGDGGPAAAASFRRPEGVAADEAGNLYISDKFNHRIRRVDPSGIITTVVGNGAKGFSGDGGPATAANLEDPADLALDADGNLYIVDSRNKRVRVVRAPIP